LRNSGLSNRFPRYDPFGMDSFEKDPFLHDPQNLQDLIERHSRQPFLHFNQNGGRHRKILPPNQSEDEPLHPKAKIESFSKQTSQSQVMITDEDGTLEWTEKDGQKSLRATDPNGKVLFDGPIDTKEDRKGLTKNLKSRLGKLESDLANR